VKSCQLAGVPKEIGEKIAQQVADDLHKVSSSQIRELVLKHVKKVDQDLANEIIQYDIRKNKKREDFVHNYTV
jgi:catalase